MKRIDFPIHSYLLKYLVVHLKLVPTPGGHAGEREDYVLSRNDRFGILLNQLLRKPARSARHEASAAECNAVLGVNLRNFNFPYYDLTQGKLTPYCIYQFNDYVDEVFKAELYWWVREHRARRSTIKDSIRSFMVFYDVSEDDRAYETLRKDVQRNADLPPLKKKRVKVGDFLVKTSQKSGETSQKNRVPSHKSGVMSQKELLSSVREELMKLPLPIFDTPFFHHEQQR